MATKLGSLLGAAILVGVGALALQSVSNRDEETIVLSVVFKPPVRLEHPVHVIAHAGNVEIVDELVSRSPYNATVKIPKGVQVLLSAQQFGGQIGQLDCVIQVNGKIVDHSQTEEEGSIRCWHNRQS